ncbi:MAG: hypothetical protein JNK73_13105 [Bacteroidia bacterium]|nr:hypothetical protein [Bacteroidia bacterium]
MKIEEIEYTEAVALVKEMKARKIRLIYGYGDYPVAIADDVGLYLEKDGLKKKALRINREVWFETK